MKIQVNSVVAAVGSLSLLLLVGNFGCSTGEGTASSSSDAAQIAAGKAAFASNGCGNCHAVGGQGSGNGPDLTKVGAEAGHTAEWLAEHVKNPQSHKPSSQMPAYNGRIPDKEMTALGVYLASLK